MYRYFVLTSLIVLLMGCGEKSEQVRMSDEPVNATDPAQPVDKSALVEQAKASAQALGGTLKAELEAAMKTGGPVEAMSVCQIKAPELARRISAEQAMSVKRVSLKNRNPTMGVANEWQTTVLNDFETRKAGGEDLANLEYTELVDDEFRFMKAIPTSAVCLVCHGTNLNSSVTDKLAELYPQDQATGYSEGDIRGAFVVVKNLNAIQVIP